MKISRLIVLFVLIICASFLNVHTLHAQSTAPAAVTYKNPLAYVGADGNVYITSLDGTSVTPITSNGGPRGDAITQDSSYGFLRWSPDGTQLAFTGGASPARLYVTKSGEASRIPLPDVYAGYGVSAWSPDGKQLAFVAGSGPGSGDNEFDLLTLETGTSQKLSDLPIGSTGEGPAPEHALWIFADEQEWFLFSDTYTLQETSSGFLLTNGAINYSSLISSDGNESTLWKNLQDGIKAYGLLVSPDKTHIFARNTGGAPVFIDLLNEKIIPLSLLPGASVLTWTTNGKALIYSTYEILQHTFEGTPPLETDHYNYMLTLWLQDINGGKPIKLFQDQGYDFGAATVSPDNSTVVVSLITNKVFDKTQPELQLVAIPLNGGTPHWIAVGGRPAFGTVPFTAVQATSEPAVTPDAAAVDNGDNTPTPAPILNCPKAPVFRLKVGQRAKVTLGVPSNLRRSPVDGARIYILKAGSTFLVLDGPKCGTDGLAWWHVNYQGAIGWLAEGDQGGYWLEP